MLRRFAISVVVVAIFFCACGEPLTVKEAQQALEEASLASQADMVVSGTIEIATNFTIGDAVEKAASELRTFIESQMPCAQVELSQGTLTVTYGAKEGNCTYKGMTYSGNHTIVVTRIQAGEVVVDHTWTDLSNGKVKVNGTAQVTWSAANKSRRVVHDLDWTRLSDNRSANGSGDRTQTVLEGGLVEGIQIDGTRTWSGESGVWDLTIDEVEVRWIDPVPQSGTYSLDTPSGKNITMSFSRIDSSTIEVTIKSGKYEFKFNVNSLGSISQ